MRPRDVVRWRQALAMTQAEAAELCGRERSWLHGIESGERPIPRWLHYLVGWTYLFGTNDHFGASEASTAIRRMRKAWGVTQVELGKIFGVSRDVIMAAEKASLRPAGIAFAIAWVALYGSRLPFPSKPKAHVRNGRQSE